MLVWKCCLIRRRILSFYTELPAISPQVLRLNDKVSIVELSEWVGFPRYTSAKSRQMMRSAFVLAWKLSELMARVFALRDQRDAPFKWCDQMDIIEAVNQWDDEQRVLLEVAKSTSKPHDTLPHYVLGFLRK